MRGCGDDIVDHFTYVIAGDGCLMEGISQEAISLAGHLKLGKLIVLFDDNEISIDGPTSLAVSDDQVERFEASGWAARASTATIPRRSPAPSRRRARSDKPTLIACKTIIGYGAPTKQGKASTHGEPLGADEIKGAREKLGWPYAALRGAGRCARRLARGGRTRRAASARHGSSAPPSSMPPSRRCSAIRSRAAGRPWRPGDRRDQGGVRGRRRPSSPPASSSQTVLEKLVPVLPCADRRLGRPHRLQRHAHQAQTPVAPGSFAGNYIHYGVREHAMAAAMNGIALHGGIVPYGGTFLVFTDYCRPAIRLSALMGQRVIYVMTHDSIGLGEDGPTHQPVEHLAALRAIPNLNVFRPADASRRRSAGSWRCDRTTSHRSSR